MQDKSLMKRIENKDLPENLFKVIKINKEESSDDISFDADSSNKNGYFKILRLGNFQKI